MRLLNTETFHLETFAGEIEPDYAILSHTWGEDEVLFEDIYRKPGSELEWRGKGGASKVIGAVQQAIRDEYKYIWIDTCCIDKSSSTELSEAINSMFSWYEDSGVCYAYLSDVTGNDEESFKSSRWFTRGWTLQELIAPRKVKFFDSQWEFIGTRSHMAPLLESITQIRPLTSPRCNIFQRDILDFSSRKFLDNYSVCTRMYWASRRETTRTEDIAYCLMGIFNVNMPLLYGEGTKAFRRLQEEIIRQSNDDSILLYQDSARALLAKSPRDFDVKLNIVNEPPKCPQAMRIFHNSIELNLLLYKSNSEISYGILDSFLDTPNRLSRVALPLRYSDGQWVRLDSWFTIVKPDRYGRPCVEKIEGNPITILDESLITRETIRIFPFFAPGRILHINSQGGKSVMLKKIIRHEDCPTYQYGLCMSAADRKVEVKEDRISRLLSSTKFLSFIAPLVNREAAIPCLWVLVIQQMWGFGKEAWIVHPMEFLSRQYDDNLNLSYPDSFYEDIPAIVIKDMVESTNRHEMGLGTSYEAIGGQNTYITPDGILIEARLVESTFLETPVYYLEVECSRLNSDGREQGGEGQDSQC
ncbi:heterokaryon incompatibility protein-domain-containing protein [Biscogniauxia sp. FL1348]|nr:heterokaryon incompatibility protein-domain-containing protein [Biscogniauxia sp. FL1348]